MKVIAKKSKAAIGTDSLGRFSIVCQKNDVLLFKANGFYPVRKSVSGRDSVYVNMVFKGGEKNEEYALAYGLMDKDDLLYAVSHLSENNNDFSNYRDVYHLIQGKCPGVTIQYDNNGYPKIYIRGPNSVNADNTALYVVDGMPVNDLSYLSVQDIKSIDVIKDGSAAQYGTQGSNGVVIITTKNK